MDDMSLRDRIVLAAVNALAESDPLLMISVGDCEIRLGWKPKTDG